MKHAACVRGAFLTAPVFAKATRTFRGAVYDRSGDLVRASQRGPANYWQPDDPPVVDIGPAMRWVSAGVYLGHFFPHFGHFLLETLPALSHALGNRLPLIFHAWGSSRLEVLLARPFIGQVLEALAIPARRIVLVHEPTAVDRLWVPPRGSPMRGMPVAEALVAYARLAEAAKRRWPDTGSRRIYLSRRLYARNRRLEEEHLLEAQFAAQGFRIVCPEQLDFLEQVSLVARADVIAGVSGSALHLGGFLKPGSRLIHLVRKPMPQVDAVNRALGVETIDLPVELESVTEEAAAALGEQVRERLAPTGDQEGA